MKFEERPDYNYMRKIFKDLMYKRGHDYDYQYDWVIKKQGHKIPENDYADAKVAVGNIAAVQGKDNQLGPSQQQKFVEERKENKAKIGEQIVNGFNANGTARANRGNSAIKRKT